MVKYTTAEAARELGVHVNALRKVTKRRGLNILYGFPIFIPEFAGVGGGNRDYFTEEDIDLLDEYFVAKNALRDVRMRMKAITTVRYKIWQELKEEKDEKRNMD